MPTKPSAMAGPSPVPARRLGATATDWGVDLTLAHTDTNIDDAGCRNTYNREARVIFTVSKTF